MSQTEWEGDHIGGKSLTFPGQVITWVGEMPWIKGLAYGDEDGKLRYSSIDEPHKTDVPFKVIESDRPINQIAFNVFGDHRYIAA